MRATSFALAAAVLVAGCGGGSKPKPPAPQQVKQAVEGYAYAFARGDGATACALLTPAAQAELVTRVGNVGRVGDCRDAAAKLHDFAGPNVTGPFSKARADAVRVTGAQATARLVAGGHAAQVRLVKRGDAWLLTRAPGI